MSHSGDPGEGDILLSDTGSERATSGTGTMMVTHDGKTHVAWQDSTEEGYFARIRTLDRRTGDWSAPHTVGEGEDNHCRPTLTVDGDGHLHAIIGGHHSGLTYRRSVGPNDASEWTEPVVFGHNTYPYLVCGPDDTLYLTARHDDDWEGLELYTRPPGGDWESQGLLVEKSDPYRWYAAYHDALAWGPDHETLHLSTGFFEGRSTWEGEHNREAQGLHQAIGYMRSHDFGDTWERADGSPVETPATAEAVDTLERGVQTDPKPGIRHCGMAVDSTGRPYVLYVRHTPTPGETFLLTPDDEGDWQRRPLHEHVRREWPDWAPIDWQCTIDAEDTLYFVPTLVPREHPGADWDPGIYGRPPFWTRHHEQFHRIGWLESADGGQSVTVRDPVPFDPGHGQLEPTVERPTGHNRIESAPPELVYLRGESRYTFEDEVIDNGVYWVDPGNAL